MPKFKNIHTGEVREVGGNAMLEYVQAPNWEMLPEPVKTKAKGGTVKGPISVSREHETVVPSASESKKD